MKYQIELKNVSKSYTDFGRVKVPVLEQVSYAFEKGKVYAVMGVSGAGKSTLLNLIGLLDDIDDGEIYIEGNKLDKLSEDEKAEMRMKKIGFVFQEYYLNPKLTVAENIILAMKINKEITKKEYLPRVEKLLAMFGMEDYAKRYPKQLSGGEQQRVCIARALANDPGIILADEPTGNLDSANEINVLEHLQALAKQGKTVIIVTHNDITKQYADEVYYLEKIQTNKRAQ